MKAPWTRAIERRVEESVARAVEQVRPELKEAAKKEVVSEMVRAMQTSSNGTMPPMAYNYPGAGGSPYPLYGMDRPLTYATPGSPRRRPDSVIDVDTIRRFANTYDVMRSCINHLKREVLAQKFSIVAKDQKDDTDATKKRITEAKLFFTKSGGLGDRHEGRRHYELKIFEDALVLGCFATYRERTRGGRLLRSLPIDAATIRPRIDAYGWPGPGEDCWEQWIMGMMVASFAENEMVYDGLWPVTNSPWYISPVEWLISSTISALKADEWNRTWLTDGTMASDMIALPDEWTPGEIITYADYFDAMLAGSSRGRQKTKFLPGGSQRVSSGNRKDQDFGEFEMWLARRTGAIYGVMLASIGFAGEQYKVTQENSTESTTQFGAGSLLQMRKEHYDDILEELGYADLETQNGETAEESPTDRDARLATAAGPFLTINAALKESGRDTVEGGDVVMVSTRTQPLEFAVKPPEPAPTANPGDPQDAETEQDDLNRWMRKSMNRVKGGRPALCEFESSAISPVLVAGLKTMLAQATTAEDVRQSFAPFLIAN